MTGTPLECAISHTLSKDNAILETPGENKYATAAVLSEKAASNCHS